MGAFSRPVEVSCKQRPSSLIATCCTHTVCASIVLTWQSWACGTFVFGRVCACALFMSGFSVHVSDGIMCNKTSQGAPLCMMASPVAVINVLTNCLIASVRCVESCNCRVIVLP